MMLLGSLQDTGGGVEIELRAVVDGVKKTTIYHPRLSIAPVMDHDELNGRYCQQIVFIFNLIYLYIYFCFRQQSHEVAFTVAGKIK